MPNSDIINEEIIAVVDKLLEYKCISTKQHKQILIKCNLLRTKKVFVYTPIVDIITDIYACIHKYKYSYNCLYTHI